MSPSALVTMFVAFSAVQFSCGFSITKPGDKIQLEERFVAKIVKDIISKVSHFSHHVIESNETVPTPDAISSSDNATQLPTFPIEHELTNATANETSSDAPAAFPFPASDMYEEDDDDDDYEDEASEIPFSSLDPGSEYVLKVFSKLRKGNSMESATKELTAKLSSAHR